MKALRIFLSFCLVAVCSDGNTQSNEPGSEHKKLSALVGRWTIKGMEDSFLEVCEMYPGGYFLVCNSSHRSKSGGLSKGVSIMGYSTEGKHLTYYHYGSSGVSQTLTGRTDDKGSFYFEGEEMINGKRTSTRVAMLKAGVQYDFKEEISIDGGPWTTSTEIVYIKAK